MPTHYEVLGVTRGATAEEIKRAYHARARLYHPDGHANAPAAVRVEAERSMQTVNLAWQVLRDSRQRRRYDHSLDLAGTDEPAASRRMGRRRRPEPSPAAALGTGFTYWLGGVAITTSGGRAAYNLRVNGATSLAPLAGFAPDRLLGLHAAGSAVTDGELVHLRDITSLRVLDLSDTAVTDAGLLHLQACTGLESLWLWNTAITDAGLALVARLPALRQLGLGNTSVTDAGLTALGAVESLRVLQLWGTGVRGPGLTHLHRLRQLETITLPRRVRARDRWRLRSALATTSVA